MIIINSAEIAYTDRPKGLSVDASRPPYVVYFLKGLRFISTKAGSDFTPEAAEIAKP